MVNLKEHIIPLLSFNVGTHAILLVQLNIYLKSDTPSCAEHSHVIPCLGGHCLRSWLLSLLFLPIFDNVCRLFVLSTSST